MAVVASARQTNGGVLRPVTGALVAARPLLGRHIYRPPAETCWPAQTSAAIAIWACIGHTAECVGSFQATASHACLDYPAFLHEVAVYNLRRRCCDLHRCASSRCALDSWSQWWTLL